MLNTTQRNTTTINAVSGTLVKTHPQSRFVRFHMKSKMADYVLSAEGGRQQVGSYSFKEIVVLQVMLCGEEEFLVEIVDEDHYFETGGEV